MSVKQYRKIPVVIEAFCWGGSAAEAKERRQWAGRKITIGSHPQLEVSIKTLEGTMVASRGDYIIKGVQGELYPCKPDIFNKTYTEVTIDEQ